MDFIISKSDFNDSKEQRVAAAVDYVNYLMAGLYTIEEINPSIREIYFVDYYLAQVSNGGHLQFFYNNQLCSTVLESISVGLKRMNANYHLDIFNRAVIALENQKETFLNWANTPVHMHAEAYRDDLFKFRQFDDELDQLEETNPLLDIMYEHIAALDTLRVVEDDQVHELWESLLKQLPNYDERLKEGQQLQKENEENTRYLKVPIALCSQYHLIFQSVNALDWGEGIVSDEEEEMNRQNNIEYYHISTSEGYCYIRDDGKQATLFNGISHSVIGSAIIE